MGRLPICRLMANWFEQAYQFFSRTKEDSAPVIKLRGEFDHKGENRKRPLSALTTLVSRLKQKPRGTEGRAVSAKRPVSAVNLCGPYHSLNSQEVSPRSIRRQKRSADYMTSSVTVAKKPAVAPVLSDLRKIYEDDRKRMITMALSDLVSGELPTSLKKSRTSMDRTLFQSIVNDLRKDSITAENDDRKDSSSVKPASGSIKSPQTIILSPKIPSATVESVASPKDKASAKKDRVKESSDPIKFFESEEVVNTDNKYKSVATFSKNSVLDSSQYKNNIECNNSERLPVTSDTSSVLKLIQPTDNATLEVSDSSRNNFNVRAEHKLPASDSKDSPKPSIPNVFSSNPSGRSSVQSKLGPMNVLAETGRVEEEPMSQSNSPANPLDRASLFEGPQSMSVHSKLDFTKESNSSNLLGGSSSIFGNTQTSQADMTATIFNSSESRAEATTEPKNNLFADNKINQFNSSVSTNPSNVSFLSPGSKKESLFDSIKSTDKSTSLFGSTTDIKLQQPLPSLFNSKAFSTEEKSQYSIFGDIGKSTSGNEPALSSNFLGASTQLTSDTAQRAPQASLFATEGWKPNQDSLFQNSKPSLFLNDNKASSNDMLNNASLFTNGSSFDNSGSIQLTKRSHDDQPISNQTNAFALDDGDQSNRRKRFSRRR